MKANCLNDLGRLDEAIDLYNHLININPTLFIAFGGRGIAYQKMGQLDKGISDLDYALKHERKNAALFTQRALIHIENDDFKTALADLDKALRIDKQLEAARLNRAMVLRMLGEKKKALRDFEKVSDESEFDSEIFLQKGVAYLKNKDYSNALKYHDLAIKEDPTYVEAIYSRSIVYCEMKEYEKSMIDIKQAESIAPPDYMCYIMNMFAFLNYRMKNFDKAIEFAQRTLKEFPDFFWANLTLAEIYGELRIKDEFYENLQIAIKGGVGFEDIDIKIRKSYAKDKEFKKLTKKMKRIGPYG